MVLFHRLQDLRGESAGPLWGEGRGLGKVLPGWGAPGRAECPPPEASVSPPAGPPRTATRLTPIGRPRGCLKNTAAPGAARPSGCVIPSCVSHRSAARVAPPAQPSGAWGRRQHSPAGEVPGELTPGREASPGHVGRVTAGGEGVWPVGSVPVAARTASPPAVRSARPLKARLIETPQTMRRRRRRRRMGVPARHFPTWVEPA